MPNDDAACEPDNPASTSPYYYTPSPSISLCRQRQYSDTPSREDYVASVLRSLECDEKAPSRKLSRTLSTRAYCDGRPQSTLGTRSYLPLTRRSLSLLESVEDGRASHRRLSSSASDKYNYNYRPFKSPSLLVDRPYKGSSASDCGDYLDRSVTDTLSGTVLPPLPYSISSYRRRDPKRNYSQHFPSGNECSGEKEEAPATNTEVKCDNLLQSESPQPVKTINSKENSFAKHASSISTSHLTGGVTLDCNSQKMASATDKNALRVSKNETNNDSEVCEANAADQCKNVSSGASKVNTLASASGRCDNQETKHRSQIPSLLRFRSLSVSRDLDTSKPKKDALVTGAPPTPEKSILSKFFRQGSEDRISSIVSGTEESEKRKSGNSSRRISRFLRPDFFDTPREESEYVRQKEAKKAAEAEEKVLARKKKLAEKLDATKKAGDSNKVVGSDTSAKKLNITKKSLNIKKTENLSKDNGDKEEKKNGAKKLEVSVKDEKLEKKDVGVNNVCKKGDKAKSEAFVKQAGKNSFLHSLEKRLEKFCSSGDAAVPANRNSRVDKAIRSLRESSVAPPSSATSITESNLLKRAVSADDCSSLVPVLPAGSSTSKVNSVLGLFRKLEGTSAPQNHSLAQRPKRPTSMIVDQVKRSQVAYIGSHSDSILLSQTPIKAEGKAQGNTDHADAKDTPAAENMTTGKPVSAIHKPVSKRKVIKDEQDVSSVSALNKNEGQATVTEKDNQPIIKEPARSANPKSIPRPTSLKGLKDTAVDNVSSVTSHAAGDKVTALPKQHVPEVGSKLLEGRRGTSLQTGSNIVTGVVSESAQQLDRRSKLLTLPFSADDDSSLVSPGDESGSQSFDSWSVSSDLEGRENLSSPIPPYSTSEGIEESVSDRIRRKSFYSRFNNTKRSSRKSSVPVLSSSYSSSLQDPSNASQSRKAPTKQSNACTKSSRSQSLYAEDNLPSYGRKSPIHNRGCYGQYSSDLVNNVGSADMNHNLQNGFAVDTGDECSGPDYGRVNHLDGYYMGDYSPYTCRSAERRLSRPTDFIKDVRRSSSMLPGLYGYLRAPSSAYVSSCARYGLLEGEVHHLGKYSRYNSHSAAEPPSNAGREELPSSSASEQQGVPSND